tara:strand:- start:1684 stop:2241 length:558 start_codon:yes stop_codon:yes gene_type:complete
MKVQVDGTKIVTLARILGGVYALSGLHGRVALCFGACIQLSYLDHFVQAAVSPIQALHSWQSKNLVDTGTVLSEVEGTFSLLDANHGGRGRAAARGAVVDALRRRLEAVVPNLGYNVRVSLIESSWAFSCLPELHPVTVTLTETWPGEMPANMACALHKWPEDAFMRLPKVVRWKSALRTIRNSR